MNSKDSKSLDNRIYKGLLWRFLERGSVQAVSFVVQIIMARILMPEDFGILTIINVFIAFAYTIINNGLGSALIQKKEIDENDCCTIFYIQLGLAGILVLILYLCAPYIARFYENEDICNYLRVMLVILVLEALASIQTVILRRRMNFRYLFYANISGSIGSAIVGITMALNGFGCWSLIWSQIALKLVVVIALKILLRWRPRGKVVFQNFKQLFSFSWKLSVGWIVGTLHQQLYSLVIGKFFSTEILGQYNRGQSLPTTVSLTSNETISTVMFSALSKLQTDKEAFKEYTRKMMQDVAFIISPIMAGIAGVARPFTIFFLTDKWEPSILMMQLFCISYGINIISTTNMQAFNALGKSEVFMKLELIKRSLSLVLLIIVAKISVYAVIISLAFMGVFSLVYNTFPNRKLLDYKISEQLTDLVPSIAISLVMFGIVSCIEQLGFSYGITLIIQIVVGIISYVIMSFVFRIPSMFRMINLFKSLKVRNTGE